MNQELLKEIEDLKKEIEYLKLQKQIFELQKELDKLKFPVPYQPFYPNPNYPIVTWYFNGTSSNAENMRNTGLR